MNGGRWLPCGTILGAGVIPLREDGSRGGNVVEPLSNVSGRLVDAPAGAGGATWSFAEVTALSPSKNLETAIYSTTVRGIYSGGAPREKTDLDVPLGPPEDGQGSF